MRCYCCNRTDATFKDKRLNRYYCTGCKDVINEAVYNDFGWDDLNRIFKINDADEISKITKRKERYKE